MPQSLKDCKNYPPNSPHIFHCRQLKKGHLAGLRHPCKSAQGFELLDVGFGELIAAGGKLFNGDKALAGAFFHRVLSGRLTQTVDAGEGGSSPPSVTRNLAASDL